MSYEQIKDLRPADFKRYCGVEPETFQRMVELVSKRLTKERCKTGRPPKLSVEDQVLLTLEYWREYRTLFHLATSWGLHESNVCRIIRRVEDILTKSRRLSCRVRRSFSLPTTRSNLSWWMSPKPLSNVRKKAESLLQWQKEAAHLEKPGGHQRAHPSSHLHSSGARPRS